MCPAVSGQPSPTLCDLQPRSLTCVGAVEVGTELRSARRGPSGRAQQVASRRGPRNGSSMRSWLKDKQDGDRPGDAPAWAHAGLTLGPRWASLCTVGPLFPGTWPQGLPGGGAPSLWMHLFRVRPGSGGHDVPTVQVGRCRRTPTSCSSAVISGPPRRLFLGRTAVRQARTPRIIPESQAHAQGCCNHIQPDSTWAWWPIGPLHSSPAGLL